MKNLVWLETEKHLFHNVMVVDVKAAPKKKQQRE